MKVEVRNNSVHIDGYVNVHSRDSRQLPSPRGFFVEQIMPNAMGDALHKATNVDLLFNHKEGRKLGSTTEGNLTLFEDSIGLRAICDVNDAEVVDKARRGELTGWSFGFVAREQRWAEDGGVQRRYVDSLDLLEVSILDVTPAYIATTIEARDEASLIGETRFHEFTEKATVIDPEPQEQEQREDEQEQREFDYSVLETTILALKLRG